MTDSKILSIRLSIHEVLWLSNVMGRRQQSVINADNKELIDSRVQSIMDSFETALEELK